MVIIVEFQNHRLDEMASLDKVQVQNASRAESSDPWRRRRSARAKSDLVSWRKVLLY